MSSTSKGKTFGQDGDYSGAAVLSQLAAQETATHAKRAAAAKKGAATRAAKRAALVAESAKLAELREDAANLRPLAEIEAEAIRVGVMRPKKTKKSVSALRVTDETDAAIASLTEAGREFMTAVGTERFDFFDEGITEGSGNWGEGMSWQFAEMSDRKPRSVSGIMSRLSVSGLWTVSDAGDGDGNWWSLTKLGAAVANRLAENAKSAADAESAQNAWDAQTEREDAASAPKRVQRRSSAKPCDWFGCTDDAWTTRVLAGQTWNVCEAHA